MKRDGISVGLVGLGFGEEFVPIYMHHPDVRNVVICDPDEDRLSEAGDRYGCRERCSNLSDLLESSDIDAIHLVTPIPLHAQQTLAVMEAGKHCACTVPMATRIDDLRAIVELSKHTGLNYMMMETAVYTREFLYVQDMARNGKLGHIQFLRGAHYQDMENWPSYWMGLPPMHYATHAVAPLLAIANTRAKSVHCFGSGTMREELHAQYGNRFPVETAIFRLENNDLAAEVTRSLFHTARAYTESFSVYGEDMSFEWQQIESEEPVVFEMAPLVPGCGRPITANHVSVPDRGDLLPPEIARFTRRGVYDESNPHVSFMQGGGHGGSHPHMVHEFVRSIIEKRKPKLDAVTAANWTAAGICAHSSAELGGELVDIPSFE